MTIAGRGPVHVARIRYKHTPGGRLSCACHSSRHEYTTTTIVASIGWSMVIRKGVRDGLIEPLKCTVRHAAERAAAEPAWAKKGRKGSPLT